MGKLRSLVFRLTEFYYTYLHQDLITLRVFLFSANAFSKIPLIDTQLEEDSGSVRRDFNRFVASILTHISAIAEMQENSILM